MVGRRSQSDFEDEIRAHLELEAERLRAQGMSPADAERAARRNFGNVGVAEDRFYHAGRFVSVQDSARDLRHAWRALRRTPGFLATCILTLGLAIGAVTGMFSVVNAVILRPLPFASADRLVSISGTAPGSDLPERFGPAAEFYLHYKERSTLLDGIFVFAAGRSSGFPWRGPQTTCTRPSACVRSLDGCRSRRTRMTRLSSAIGSGVAGSDAIRRPSVNGTSSPTA